MCTPHFGNWICNGASILQTQLICPLFNYVGRISWVYCYGVAHTVGHWLDKCNLVLVYLSKKHTYWTLFDFEENNMWILQTTFHVSIMSQITWHLDGKAGAYHFFCKHTCIGTFLLYYFLTLYFKRGNWDINLKTTGKWKYVLPK